MNSGESEDHPLLTLLLNERLPTLGLDVETYGPYIVALFPISNTPDDSLVDDLEGWEEILELLQASSEFQDLDDSVWEQLKVDLVSTWQNYRKLKMEQHKEKLLEKEQHLQKVLELERDMALLNAENKVKDSSAAVNGNNNNSSIDDATKRALLNRFGYEDDTNDDNDGKEGGGKTKADAGDASNVTTAKPQQHPPVTTKREEQQKTKAAQQQKVDAKEERRKRAVKGERRR